MAALSLIERKLASGDCQPTNCPKVWITSLLEGSLGLSRQTGKKVQVQLSLAIRLTTGPLLDSMLPLAHGSKVDSFVAMRL
jgi:hypothetical protein